MTTSEQQYQAELLRQRQRERMHTEEAEKEEGTDESPQPLADGLKKPPRKEFPVRAIEVGLWLLPAMMIDTFEFFGQAVAAIPIVGLPLAGASSIIGAVMSGIMVLLVALWLFLKRVSPFTPTGLRVFSVLGGTAFGNGLVNWLPAWSGFFLWLFFMAHKRETWFLGKNK